jgi:hypothetical protein
LADKGEVKMTDIPIKSYEIAWIGGFKPIITLCLERGLRLSFDCG